MCVVSSGFTSFFNGLVVFTILGFMAKSSGIPIETVAKQSGKHLGSLCFFPKSDSGLRSSNWNLLSPLNWPNKLAKHISPRKSLTCKLTIHIASLLINLVIFRLRSDIDTNVSSLNKILCSENSLVSLHLLFSPSTIFRFERTVLILNKHYNFTLCIFLTYLWSTSYFFENKYRYCTRLEWTSCIYHQR